MEDQKLAEMMDQERWLLNSGLVTDGMKNQLFFFGSIVHKDVQAVEVDIKPDEKQVQYKIYVTKDVLGKIETYKKLSTATSLFGLWRFKRFLKKEGTLDFLAILNNFVTQYCGPKWSVECEIRDFDVYIDDIGVESEADRESQPTNK
jgi:hypothetical protein